MGPFVTLFNSVHNKLVETVPWLHFQHARDQPKNEEGIKCVSPDMVKIYASDATGDDSDYNFQRSMILHQTEA